MTTAITDDGDLKSLPYTVVVDAKHLTETSLHSFVVEASTLGWKPGVWPQRFRLTSAFGNDQPFWVHHQLRDGGYAYWQDNGCVEIKVFND